jgi:putative membrane protein
MSDPTAGDEHVTPNVSTILATDRTRLAHDRTLMAWVRTSTSLISFGFTIYKFFQYLQQQQGGRHEGRFGPRQYATLMIVIGILALVIATLQHRRDMKALRAHYPEVPYSMATVLAGLISILGVLALLAVVFRQ